MVDSEVGQREARHSKDGEYQPAMALDLLRRGSGWVNAPMGIAEATAILASGSSMSGNLGKETLVDADSTAERSGLEGNRSILYLLLRIADPSGDSPVSTWNTVRSR